MSGNDREVEFAGLGAQVEEFVAGAGCWLGGRCSLSPGPSPGGGGEKGALEVGDQGFVHHVIDHFARGIEGATFLAGSRLGVRVVTGKQVFKDLAEQFRVEGDFFFHRGVFLDGEFVALEYFQQTARFVFAVLGLVDVVEVHPLLAIAEEEFVGHIKLVIRALGKTIDAKHGLAAFLNDQRL